MKIHFSGICGTFMGSLALLAREAGHTVVGSDQNVYPPMSDLLREQGIEIRSGYAAAHLRPQPDLVIVGNALSRGNPEVESVLDGGISFTSGPQWLGEQILTDRKVISIAGTHGKTTTSSMVAWILEYAGLEPGFLIGGVPENFPVSARTGRSEWFVIEADEYDTAFFDKRSKFVHYRPHIQVLNNLEFDHADIFANLEAIQTQFHHLVRIVPRSGRLVLNSQDANLAAVLEQGCWTPVTSFSTQHHAQADWSVSDITGGGASFRLTFRDKPVGQVQWALMGRHNIANALAAAAAACHAGVEPGQVVEALSQFLGVRRRLTDLGTHGGVQVYDDFAHHPTAIALTVKGLRERLPGARVLVGLEPRSNTMRSGIHGQALGEALAEADYVAMLKQPDLSWSIDDSGGGQLETFPSVHTMLAGLLEEVRPQDVVVFMSNGGFEGAPAKFVAMLEALQ